MPSPSQLVFYSPRVAAGQTAKVHVTHEYLSITVTPIDFVYTDISGSILGVTDPSQSLK